MSYQDAIIEAYATASSDEVIFDTIELVHPGFRNDDGSQMSVRLVLGHDDIKARLDAGAVLNPGEVVTWYGADFKLTMPETSTDAVPSLTMSIANISREITKHIEEAALTYDPIQVYYRPYLLSELLEGPQVDPPFLLELADVTADVFQVSGTATLDNVHNFPFPNKTYTPAIFKGLSR